MVSNTNKPIKKSTTNKSRKTSKKNSRKMSKKNSRKMSKKTGSGSKKNPVCELWLKNTLVDPVTKKTIEKNSNVYIDYVRKCHQLGQLSGDESEYIPDKWNHPNVISRFNCYDYSGTGNTLNHYQTNKTQPGEIAGVYDKNKKQVHHCNWLLEKLKQDHPKSYAADFQPACKAGYYKIASTVANSSDNGKQDYHFLRQDANGLWSHKPGAQAVSQLDALQNPIVDPKKANLNYLNYQYKTFCGYTCMPKDSYKNFAKKKDGVLPPKKIKELKKMIAEKNKKKKKS